MTESVDDLSVSRSDTEVDSTAIQNAQSGTPAYSILAGNRNSIQQVPRFAQPGSTVHHVVSTTATGAASGLSLILSVVLLCQVDQQSCLSSCWPHDPPFV